MSAFSYETALPRPELVAAAGLPRGSEVNMAFIERTRERSYQVIIGTKFKVGLIPEERSQKLHRLFDKEVALIKKLAEELQS
jgi:hypothetical protein